MKLTSWQSILLPLIAFAPLCAAEKRPPNVVIIFLDDSGFSDFQPFGSGKHKTPHVQELAEEGMQLNQFYVPQAVCSASRAALLSGCYPGRTKVFGAHGPNGKGLDPKFMTLAEVLKPQGYATAHFGKWHVGDQPETRPLARGFDEHAGLMYSNDMWGQHPVDPEFWGKHPLQYWKEGKIKIGEVSEKDQTQLTTWATEYSVDFIRRHKDQPFFLYLAHSMPHVPLFCSDKFLGKSGTGLYGDVIMEIDWSIGQVMQALKEAGVEENTLVIFSSDNGPWLEYGNHAGTTPYREHKGTGFDGGIRSATLMKWPGKITAGSQLDRAICSVDLLPTIAKLAGAKLPSYEIDGRDVWPLIANEPDAENPHDYYPFSSNSELQGVISGDGNWKLHLPHNYHHVVEAGADGRPGKKSYPSIGLALFDLKNDPYETTDVTDKYPEITAQLKALALAHKAKFYTNPK